MHSNLALTTGAPDKPAIPAQNAPAHRPAKAEASTIPLGSSQDPASRVVAQLDGLTAALQSQSAGQSAPKTGAGHSDGMSEECLESYLRDYMQKLTGKSQESAAPVREIGPAKQETPRTEAVEEPTARREPTPAPEQRDQITALREVAIASAREAMAKSSQVQLMVMARRAYLQAKAVSLASSALALAYCFTHANAAIYSAALLFPVALFLSCRFGWLFRCCGASAR